MADQTDAGDVVFRAVIRGLNIDAATRARIDRGIRKVVMREIAGIDHLGDLQITPEGEFPDARTLGAGIGGRTAGIAVQVREK
jgi:hypothetical protein